MIWSKRPSHIRTNTLSTQFLNRFLKSHIAHGDKIEEEGFRREDIEWLKKQIEKMDSEENLEENSSKQILDDELNEFFMKLSRES